MAKGDDVAKRIRAALEEATASVEDIASEAGVSSATLWAWMGGRRGPQPETLRKVAAALRERESTAGEAAADLEALADELERE